MQIAIGCDELGYELKKHIIAEIGKLGYSFIDFGVSENEKTDYPEIAYSLATEVAKGKFERGILICGTGIGMAMSANKVKGIRAAVCHDIYSTERSVLSNNAQIMCMGALVIGKQTAVTLTKTWLGLKFVESPSSRKIAKIMKIETDSLEVNKNA